MQQLVLSEQSDFIKRAQSGDQNAIRMIMEENQWRVKMFAYIFAEKIKNNPVYDVDDLISVGNEGLYKAIFTYEPEKASFATFSLKVIQNNMRTLLRKTYKDIRLYSLNQKLKFSGSLTFADILASDSNFVYEIIDAEFKKVVSNIVATLDGKKQLYLNLRFGFDQEPLTQSQIVKIMCMDQPSISRFEKKILRELKENLITIRTIEGVIEVKKSNRTTITIYDKYSEFERKTVDLALETLDDFERIILFAKFPKESDQINQSYSQIAKQFTLTKGGTISKIGTILNKIDCFLNIVPTKSVTIYEKFPANHFEDINLALQLLNEYNKSILLLRFPLQDNIKALSVKEISEKFHLPNRQVYRIINGSLEEIQSSLNNALFIMINHSEVAPISIKH